MDMALPIRSPTSVPTIAGHMWKLFGTSVVLVLVLVAALFWDVSQLGELRATARRADFIEHELREVGEGLVDAESGARGYLLTADANYLAPYVAGTRQARHSMETLSGSVVDPNQDDDFTRLQPLVTEELRELDAIVDSMRAGNHEGARSRMMQGPALTLMEQIRAIRSRIIDRQFALIQVRRNQSDANSFDTKLTLLLGSLAFIALLFLNTRTATRKLGRPVQALIGRMRALTVAAGEAPAPPPAMDEITWLSQEFNETVNRLKAAARERDRSERALVESRARLQVILDNFPGLVSNLDPQLHFRFVNRTFADWFRIDPAEVIGTSLRDLIGEAAFDSIAESARAALIPRSSQTRPRR